MFVLKKIITAFLLPQGLLIAILIVSAIFLKKRFRFCAIALAALIYLASIEPTAELLLRPLEDMYKLPSSSQIKACDVYVVLGGGINENIDGEGGTGMLDSHSLARVVAAYRLYVKAEKPIIISGGRVGQRQSIADIAQRVLLSWGVPQNRIIPESKSADTYENAQYTKELADKYRFRKILLVTSAFHLKRSSMLFSKHFTDIVPYPADYQTSRSPYDILSFLPSAAHLCVVEIAIREYLGIAFYSLRE